MEKLSPEQQERLQEYLEILLSAKTPKSIKTLPEVL